MNTTYFAEFNTDQIVREKYFPDFNYHGVMIEVGGGTPSYLSMSKHFKLTGWRCIIVEPNPKYASMHRNIGNEIYEYACSNEDKDDVNFQVVHFSDNYNANKITDHSFSAISVKPGYLKHSKLTIDKLPIRNIKIKTRKLDTILNELKLDRIDFLSIDVEGWELEVLAGFDLPKHRPRVVLIENWLHDPSYVTYMNKLNYKLDKKIHYNYIFST